MITYIQEHKEKHKAVHAGPFYVMSHLTEKEGQV